jgi:7-cyano-7-deazaguanine synthase
MTTKALVVLSGGQDSTTCLFWAKEHYDEVHAITFDYGQRHSLEIEAALKVGEMAGVRSHRVVELGPILESASPLTSDNELEQYDDFKTMDEIIGNRVEKTFVPMRNTLFLTLAANRAIALGIDTVVTGVCQEDNANYPDCREDFIQALEVAFCESLGTLDFHIKAPLMFLSKADTVNLAATLAGCYDALAYSHTSYDGKYPPTDMNHANVLRAHGFEEAGMPDPLVVRAWQEGLMDLPETENYNYIRESAQ